MLLLLLLVLLVFYDVRCTDPEAELLFTTEGNLRSLTLDGRIYTGIVTHSDELIQSIDFDLTTDTLYWNDLNAVSVFDKLNTIDNSLVKYSFFLEIGHPLVTIITLNLIPPPQMHYLTLEWPLMCASHVAYPSILGCLDI